MYESELHDASLGQQCCAVNIECLTFNQRTTGIKCHESLLASGMLLCLASLWMGGKQKGNSKLLSMKKNVFIPFSKSFSKFPLDGNYAEISMAQAFNIC